LGLVVFVCFCVCVCLLAVSYACIFYEHPAWV
jgi:hypothetical protein